MLRAHTHNRKSSVILAFSRTNSQSLVFCQDSGELRSRARETTLNRALGTGSGWAAGVRGVGLLRTCFQRISFWSRQGSATRRNSKRGGQTLFRSVASPSVEELQGLLQRMIKRLLTWLTRHGYLVQEQGQTYVEQGASDLVLCPLQSASCTYRIAFGARAGAALSHP